MNGSNLKPSHLIAFLAKAIPQRLPILITGSPGGGKTDIGIKVCKMIGHDMILSHPAVSDPTDYKGLPWPGADRETATFLPFGDFARALKATKPTVWFLDDIGQASVAVQAALMQLILSRRVNDQVLPDWVTFLAATNRRNDRAGVTGILETVKSRFAAIIGLEVDLGDWCTWGFENGIPETMISFMRFRGVEVLNGFTPTADLTNCPLPRTWASAAKLLKLGLTEDVEFAALSGAVGEGAAGEYMAYRRQVATLPSIDEIFKDPMKPKIPSGKDRMSLMYAVATAVGVRTTIDNLPVVVKYCERLMDEELSEFAAIILKDALLRDGNDARAMARTKAFIKLSSGKLGELLGSAMSL